MRSILVAVGLFFFSLSTSFYAVGSDNLERPGNMQLLIDRHVKGYRISLHDSPALQIVMFDGDIGFGASTKAITEVMKKAKKGKSILLFNVNTSSGGYTSSFQKFGEQFRAICKGYESCDHIVYSRMKCNSACILLTMYANERWVNQKTTFGFHREWIFTPEFTPTGDNAWKSLIALGMSEEWFARNMHIFDPQYQRKPLPLNYTHLEGSNLYTAVIGGTDDKELDVLLQQKYGVIVPLTYGYNYVTKERADFAFDKFYYYSKAFRTGNEPTMGD